MEGNLRFKQARIDHGYTLEQLSKLTGVKSRMLTNYQNGNRRLEALRVYSCLELFDPLDLDPEEFFESSLHYKESCDDKISEWKAAHPRDYCLSSLRNTTYGRITHLKYRGTVSDEDYEYILSGYKDCFNQLSHLLKTRDCQFMSENEYETFYLTYIYNVKKRLYYSSSLELPTGEILEKYLRSEYSSVSFSFLSKDFAIMIDHPYVSKLRGILSGKIEIGNLSILSALKLCYVLNIDFANIFRIVKNTT